MLDRQIADDEVGTRIQLTAPDHTTSLPPGEYTACVHCACPWMIVLKDIRTADGNKLPVDFRTGNLRQALVQPESPSPGINPECPHHRGIVGGGNRTYINRIGFLPLATKPKLHGPKDSKGNPIGIGKYDWVRRRS